MQKHPFTRLARLGLTAAVAAALLLAAFGLGVTVGARHPDARASASLGLEPGASVANAQAAVDGGAGKPPVLDMNLFREAWGLIEKQYYGDLPQGKEVTYDAIRGVVDRLGDQHTGFLDPQNAVLANDMEGHFEGIGARVELATGGGVLITYLYPKQPAEQAGLQVGDVILAVDGKDITRLGLNDVISQIRGPSGTKVTLTIRRGAQPFDVTVRRTRIEIQVVTTKTLGEGRVQYISLSEFSGIAPARLAAALKTAVAQRPAGIVFDLRGNPGGYLDAAVRIGSYFVPAGATPGDNIVLERFKDGTEHQYARTGDFLMGDIPLVVLVDGGSASASEIVAGAIQDAHSGVLMGEKTYGKGSVQLANTLSDGSQLRITVAHWFTPKGRGIHGTGLQPDVTIGLSAEDVKAGRDPQLDRAVRWLLGDHSLPPAATPALTGPSPTPAATETPGAGK